MTHLAVLALVLGASAVASPARAQTAEAPPSWSASLATYAYLLDDGFVSPVATADKNALHREARDQYEALETFSFWAGRRFTTDGAVALDVVAMAGASVGRIDGFAPGIEASLTWRRFELYAESEAVFDTQSEEGDLVYTWAQLGWEAAPWLTLGLSAQRTRAYDREKSIERGVFAAARRGRVELSAFGFDLGDDPFAIVALGVDHVP